ncbi:MAG: D-alanine--D-alanine ligase [Verrucomicrobiales bacterium]|jgi:D-alanine-D-alanine ligase|nr:D-alanine--D-alanine ligase [Verrucomicrobiales bacterium]
MMRRLKIVVMLGGPSAEREVSLKTGRAAAQALAAKGHQVTEVDALPGQWKLPAGTEVVFLALHGTYGEDGEVQRELEALGVPYTGCSPAASALAFDKVLTKQKCRERGVPVARDHIFHNEGEPFPNDWQLPVVLKPVRQGSSVGLHFVTLPEQWAESLKSSLQHGSEVLMEERIEGRETTVGILDGKALPLVEMRPKKGGYTYANKYTPGATEYFCPASFSNSVSEKIQEAAVGAFNAVGGRDYARVDVMVRDDGSPVVLEVNTLPGMTETSLLPKAAAAIGLSYEDLCEKMVELAMKRAPNVQK